ncbi:haloacid dehalogenase-like hydrolase [Alphaproteobacteria bacterium endosymbiont of Tiliacea citrago]|uniref:haloacid dehalogenase-like hydrolase n=1 Tax=Alphaproteobacteria bacterium endosymbiont of Tiliacea citrago TaxID=3077944 RepID=UPI00313DAFA1
MFIMVDLDNTFFKLNINWFLFFYILKKDFFFALKIMFFYLFKGRARCKRLLSSYIDLFNLDVFVNGKVLEFLELQRKDSKIVLATGSNEYIASKVVEKFSVFEGYIASDDIFNCVGENKLKKILEYTNNLPFFYIGDSYVDIPVWEASSKIGVVNPSLTLIKKIQKLGKEYVVFYD